MIFLHFFHGVTCADFLQDIQLLYFSLPGNGISIANQNIGFASSCMLKELPL